ncbi:hypothetical protein CDAR_408621 [Caerostris darwini]|uniref:Uncharacterized protein n=1 Tax=Caerostris darwini TaxID=1538125 RepID=A0AAV4MFB1_9ARAC|nr:hypothetical protein CDAR_408621 [Caerostris darwini]
MEVFWSNTNEFFPFFQELAPVSNVERIVYVFVCGEKGTGKTTLIEALLTTHIADPDLPSFPFLQEYTYYGLTERTVLRLVELKREHLYLQEIKELCTHQKHIFVFVYAIDDLPSICYLKTRWIPYAKRLISPGILTAVVENKTDLRSEANRNILSSEFTSYYESSLGMNYTWECSALDRQKVHQIFLQLANLVIREFDLQ